MKNTSISKTYMFLSNFLRKYLTFFISSWLNGWVSPPFDILTDVLPKRTNRQRTTVKSFQCAQIEKKHNKFKIFFYDEQYQCDEQYITMKSVIGMKSFSWWTMTCAERWPMMNSVFCWTMFFWISKRQHWRWNTINCNKDEEQK